MDKYSITTEIKYKLEWETPARDKEHEALRFDFERQIEMFINIMNDGLPKAIIDSINHIREEINYD